MKKKVFSIMAILTIAIVTAISVNFNLFRNNSQNELVFGNIEALARGEGGGGAQVTCRCSRMTVGSCAANNMSDVCAGGDNIQCWTYNANCN